MHDVVRPPRLSPNALIGVAAPSGPIAADRLAAGIDYLHGLGYRTRLAANVEARTGFTAGDLEARLDGLMELHQDSEVDAIILARGGAGAIDLLDRLPWEQIVARPKIWMGFSDFAVLGSAALVAGMTTFHGPMVAADFRLTDQPRTLAGWQGVLGGEDYPRRWPLTSGQVWRSGTAAGPAVGGCLSPLTALVGTPWEAPMDGSILFWEEIAEPPYRLARLLTALRLGGRLKHLKGMVIGALSGCSGAGGGSPEELRETLLAALGNGDFPVVVGLPFGHQGANLAFALGQPVTIDTAAGELVFEQPGVE